MLNELLTAELKSVSVTADLTVHYDLLPVDRPPNIGARTLKSLIPVIDSIPRER